MTTATPYFRTFVQSFQILGKQPQLFFPLLVNFIFSLLFTPYFNSLMTDITNLEDSLLVYLSLLLLMVSISFIIFTIITGWLFAMLHQVFQIKDSSLKSSIMRMFPFAWKLFKVEVLLGLFVGGFFVTLVIGFLLGFLIVSGALSLNPTFGVIVTFILGLLGLIAIIIVLVLMILLAFYYFQLLPILALEERGAWSSLKITLRYFRTHISQSSKFGILSIIIVFLAYIPYYIFLFITGGFAQNEGYSLSYEFIALFLTIPGMVISLAVIVAYCIAYKK